MQLTSKEELEMKKTMEKVCRLHKSCYGNFTNEEVENSRVDRRKRENVWRFGVDHVIWNWMRKRGGSDFKGAEVESNNKDNNKTLEEEIIRIESFRCWTEINMEDLRNNNETDEVVNNSNG